MSQVLVSFLSGFGFQAYVVCGWSDRGTSIMDRTKEFCKLLKSEEVITYYSDHTDWYI